MHENRQESRTLSDDLFCIRGVGILLVVVIHVLGVDAVHGVRRFFSPDRWELQVVAELIHSFNMSVMVIGSGVAMAAFGKPDTSLRKFARKKLDKLIVPMLIWAPVLYVVQTASEGAPGTLGGWLSLLAQLPGTWFPPYSIFWFVHALVWCTLLAWLFRRFAAPVLGRWGGLVSLGLAILLYRAVRTWGPSVGIEQGDYVEFILYWHRFFSLGMLIQPWLVPLRAWLARLPGPLLALLFVGLFSVLALVYAALHVEASEWVFAINGPLGFSMLLTFAVLVRTRMANRGAFWGWSRDRLTFIGSTSMSFYLFHLYFVSGSRILLERLHPGTPVSVHLLFGVLLGCLGPWAIIQFVRDRPSFHSSIGLSGLPTR
jgi:fucose 4-O-acetylase-like acetyltransferase